jgi:hypothetical protein
VAQGTHTGILSGEFGGDAVTAIRLPATSGSGIPAITDWVTCSIGNGFSNGFDPHTLTAYLSPNSSHAVGVLANSDASTLAGDRPQQDAGHHGRAANGGRPCVPGRHPSGDGGG